MKNIICVIGKARNGKDTFYEIAKSILPAGHCHHISFARKLKEQAYALGWDGKKDDKGRTLLQHLSRPVKDYFGEDYYAQQGINDILNMPIFDDNQFYFITDMRFKVEFDLFQKLNLQNYRVSFVRIVRDNKDWASPLSIAQQNDPSETELDAVDIDNIIHNNGSLEDLKEKVKSFLETL